MRLRRPRQQRRQLQPQRPGAIFLTAFREETHLVSYLAFLFCLAWFLNYRIMPNKRPGRF